MYIIHVMVMTVKYMNWGDHHGPWQRVTGKVTAMTLFLV